MAITQYLNNDHNMSKEKHMAQKIFKISKETLINITDRQQLEIVKQRQN